jgi:hypothetical protein
MRPRGKRVPRRAMARQYSPTYWLATSHNDPSRTEDLCRSPDQTPTLSACQHRLVGGRVKRRDRSHEDSRPVVARRRLGIIDLGDLEPDIFREGAQAPGGEGESVCWYHPLGPTVGR